MTRYLAIAALAVAVAGLTALGPSGAEAHPRAIFDQQVAEIGGATDEAVPAQSRHRFGRPRGPRFRDVDRDRRSFRNGRRDRRFAPRGYRYDRRSSPGRILPMSVVAARALACHPGRILDARLQGSTYVFKILTRGGQLVRVRGDARSGSVNCR